MVPALVLIFSLAFYIRLHPGRQTPAVYLAILSLAFTPLLHFRPDHNAAILLLILFSFFLWLWSLVPRGKWVVIILALVSVFWGSLLAGKIVSWPAAVDRTRLVFDIPTYKDAVRLHQRDARYVPFPVRRLLFNPSVYTYILGNNFFRFLTLENLMGSLLLANLYPLGLGLAAFFRRPEDFPRPFRVFLLLLFLQITVSRSPDKFNSLYVWFPLLAYLILRGARDVRLKAYFLLLLISIIFVLPRPV